MRMKNRREQIEQLLHSYYEGQSSPQEELKLYLMLLEEPDNSPYGADRMLLEASWAVGVPNEELFPEKRHKVRGAGNLKVLFNSYYRNVAKYVAAAAVVGSVVVGASLYKNRGASHTGAYPLTGDVSHVNGNPIEQEEVNRYALQALSTLVHCCEVQAQGTEKIESVLSNVHDNVQRSFYDHLSGESGFYLVNQ